MVKLEEFMDIFQLKESGHNISTISRLTGRDRKTVRKYLSRGRSNPPKPSSRKRGSSKLMPYEEIMLSLLCKNEHEYIPATVIYEKLVERGYNGSLSLVQKWVAQYKQAHHPQVVIRYETLPGEQAQVDWGEKKLFDKKLVRKKKGYIFGMTLGWSRTRFVHFVEKADMYHFQLCHQLAFEYFGGIPKEILYDQNRCVLLKPGYKDIEYNQRFLDFAHHYHFIPRVCKPYRPQTKGKVENLIKYVKQNFLSTQQTANVKLLNQGKESWLKKVNTKVHSTTQEIPFRRLAREGLHPIDAFSKYDVCYIESRRVFNDSTFSFKAQRYSVPPAYIGKTVTIKYRPPQRRLDVYFQNQLLTQHRSDSLERYVIKRSHRHSIWKIWRHDKQLFYRKATQRGGHNHPLAIYEAISHQEGGGR